MGKRLLAIAILAGFLAPATMARAQDLCGGYCGQQAPNCMGYGYGYGAVPPGPPPGPPYSPSGMMNPGIHPAPSMCEDDGECWCRGWYHAEALYWYLQRIHLPAPLVTSSTGPPFGTGVLNAPNTVILLDDNKYFQPGVGGRGTAGIWFDHENTVGVEISGFACRAL